MHIILYFRRFFITEAAYVFSVYYITVYLLSFGILNLPCSCEHSPFVFVISLKMPIY
jgi:hypothetical protein